MVKSTKLVGTSTVRTKNTLHFGPLLALSFSHVPLSLFYRPASFIGPPAASEVGSPQSLAVCTARGGWGNLMSVRTSVHDWSAAWPLPRPHGHARVHIRWQPALVRQGSGLCSVLVSISFHRSDRSQSEQPGDISEHPSHCHFRASLLQELNSSSRDGISPGLHLGESACTWWKVPAPGGKCLHTASRAVRSLDATFDV